LSQHNTTQHLASLSQVHTAQSVRQMMNSASHAPYYESIYAHYHDLASEQRKFNILLYMLVILQTRLCKQSISPVVTICQLHAPNIVTFW